MRMRQPNLEMQQQMEAIYAENEHLQRELSILRETIKELECRCETHKQTLIARDESIKKLLEMLQAKGMGECFVLCDLCSFCVANYKFVGKPKERAFMYMKVVSFLN